MMTKWISRAGLGVLLSLPGLSAAQAGPSAGARIGGMSTGASIIVASVIIIDGGFVLVWFRHYLETRDRK
jgi:hypothetical protein